jgi:hypothetical protein
VAEKKDGGTLGSEHKDYRCTETHTVHEKKWEKVSEAGVLVRKFSQLTPLRQAKRANPRYFILLCGISCEIAGCVHWPIVDFESTIAG